MRQIAVTSALAMAMAAQSGIALAQSNDEETDAEETPNQIIVTAQKREQLATEVPISLTVFDAEQLDLIRATELNDYLAITPNVSVQSRSDRFSQFFTIRGAQNFGGRANALGVYVDEFNVAPASNIRGYNQNLVDVERIEVLRGPQGTAFGRNVVGGALNIVTKKPGDDFEANFTLDGGLVGGDGFNGLARGSVNVPLGEKAAFRVSGLYEYEEGWINNVNPESAAESNEYESWGMRGSLRLLPADNVTIDLTASYEDAEAVPLNLISGGIIEPGSGLDEIANGPASPFVPVPLPFDATGNGFFPSNDTDVFIVGEPVRAVETFQGTARIEAELGNVTLTSVTGFINLNSSFGVRDRLADNSIAGDTSGQNIVFNENPQDDLDSWSQELRAFIEASDSVRILIGALYAEDTEKQVEQSGTGPDTDFFGRLPFPGNPTIFPLPPSINFALDQTRNETEQFAVFGEISVDVTDRLELIVGGRYTNDSVEQTLVDQLRGRNLSADAEFDDFSARVAAVYELAAGSNLYATFSQGFKSGGINLNVGTEFDSEEVDNYEIGYKGSLLDDRLQIGVSAFWMDWKNLQVQAIDVDPTSPTFFQSFVQNPADAEMKGFEFELAARPTDGLFLAAGVGYTDAEFKGQDCTDPNFIASGEACINGTALPRLAPWTLNWAAQYDHEFNGDTSGFLRVDGNFRDAYLDFTGSLPVSPALRANAFSVWNLRAGIETGPWNVTLYAENLFDSNGIAGVRNPGGIERGGISYALVTPRAIGLRASVSY